MPTYDYQCEKCGHEFERVQRITEDPIKTCPECKSKKAKRLLSAPNFILKGGGWYADGYGSAKAGAKGGASSSSGDSGGDDSGGGGSAASKSSSNSKSSGGTSGKDSSKSSGTKSTKATKSSKSAA